MTELRLVADRPEPIAVEASAPSPAPLPRGRHGLPPDIVRTYQRGRLLEAAATAVAEQGYGRLTSARITELAGVSSRTFYQHFEDLWACVLAAYEGEAARLCRTIEGACAVSGLDRRVRARTGIATAISFLAADPAVARLLSAEPPPQVAALAAARKDLVERLGAMLRRVLDSGDATPLPGMERRLIGAALAIIANRSLGGDSAQLRAVEPELSGMLLATL